MSDRQSSSDCGVRQGERREGGRFEQAALLLGLAERQQATAAQRSLNLLTLAQPSFS